MDRCFSREVPTQAARGVRRRKAREDRTQREMVHATMVAMSLGAPKEPQVFAWLVGLLWDKLEGVFLST